MNAAHREAIRAAGLEDVLGKVETGARLSREDGVRLFRSKSLVAVSSMANLVRERRHGDRAFFVRNMLLNPTNVCVEDCKFCGFYRPYREKHQGWTWTLDQCLQGLVKRNVVASAVARNAAQNKDAFFG